MPLPLLAIPLIAAAAGGGISTGAAVAIGVGSSAAAVGSGTGAWYWWRYSTYTADQWFEFSSEQYFGLNDKKQNYHKARKYCEKAIKKDSNHCKSLVRLGDIYWKGEGVEINQAKAREYYENAELLGDYVAVQQLTIMENPTLDNANQWSTAGSDYFYGRNGKVQNYHKARACYEFSNEHDENHAVSLYKRGRLYESGLGIETDRAKAQELYHRAALLNHYPSKKQLLIMKHINSATSDQWHRLGDDYFLAKNGQSKNYLDAQICYEKALEYNPNNRRSSDSLAILAEHGRYQEATGIQSYAYCEVPMDVSNNRIKCRQMILENLSQEYPVQDPQRIESQRYERGIALFKSADILSNRVAHFWEMQQSNKYQILESMYVFHVTGALTQKNASCLMKNASEIKAISRGLLILERVGILAGDNASQWLMQNTQRTACLQAMESCQRGGILSDRIFKLLAGVGPEIESLLDGLKLLIDAGILTGQNAEKWILQSENRPVVLDAMAVLYNAGTLSVKCFTVLMDNIGQENLVSEGFAACARIQSGQISEHRSGIESDLTSALQCLKYLADKGCEFGGKILANLVEIYPECAWNLARQYQNETPEKSSNAKAYYYYAIAALKNYPEAYNVLLEFANQGDADAMYAMGYSYFHKRHETEKAIYWCMLSAEQHHTSAEKFLRDSAFDPESCRKIAEKYEQGVEGVEKNIDSAIFYYKKADPSTGRDTAFRIGQLYLLNPSGYQAGLNSDLACEYLIKAARDGHPDAPAMLDSLGDDLAPDMQINIGNMYRSAPFNNSIKAEFWYQKALGGGSPIARQLLNSIHGNSIPGNLNSLFSKQKKTDYSCQSHSRKISIR